MNKRQLENEKKQLAIARFRVIPEDFQISIGGNRGFSRDEIIKNIEKDSRIGKEMVEAQLEFLRDMARGEIYQYE